MSKDLTVNYYRIEKAIGYLTVYYGDVDHPVPGQIDHWVS